MEAGSPDILEFVVPGDPVAKGRPRVRVRGKFGQLYTPKKTADYEKSVGQWARQALGQRGPFTGPLTVTIIAVFTFPKSRTKRDRKMMVQGLLPCLKNIDIDNVAKAALDGMNEIAFEDDKQVVSLTAKKRWGPAGRLLVRIERDTAAAAPFIGEPDIADSSCSAPSGVKSCGSGGPLTGIDHMNAKGSQPALFSTDGD